jgi:predicted CoA-substrate-specific enzyme activase
MADTSAYKLGIDAGSTTVKLVLLNPSNQLVYGVYERHFTDIRKTLLEMVKVFKAEAEKRFPGISFSVVVTGSAGLSLSHWMDVPFAQEVAASKRALRRYLPEADVAIELGGEDAKILYLTGNTEERMNGACAGGTGAFIDQMASLLNTDAQGLNKLAENYQSIYPIASRCGVFAKSDVQPLINEGVRREDIAASIFQAVVHQTIAGLAAGHKIAGKVAFLGGPLHFLPELRVQFAKTLNLGPAEALTPQNSELYVAMGAALHVDKNKTSAIDAAELLRRAESLSDLSVSTVSRHPALFSSKEEFEQFTARHAKATAPRTDISTAVGPCFLGVDAGSTTTKLVLVNQAGEILHTAYFSNGGNPVGLGAGLIQTVLKALPPQAWIGRAVVTGYGEELFINAFNFDEGEVETMAHYRGARAFSPECSSILDIGGQDMKFLKIKDGALDSILLNEACSSGCGSFLETFAHALGMSAQEFAQAATESPAPPDMGSRCTVFMNSRVKQAQKEGASLSEISAGLSYSVVQNALYKVIKMKNPEEFGPAVVVQGGTFLNNAVLRAFEIFSGREVIRPDIAGLMGAYGAALIARDNADSGAKSGLVSLKALSEFSAETRQERCTGCGNRCLLTINHFHYGNEDKADSERWAVTGNKCERGVELFTPKDAYKKPSAAAAKVTPPNMFDWKEKRVFAYTPLSKKDAKRGTVGIPRVLNMYEDYPFWFTFFNSLGYRVELSPRSSHALFEAGMDTIPAESVCYPAKLVHGHVRSLLASGVDFVFYPCVPFSPKEHHEAGNHFNCPIVGSYPEVIKNNLDELETQGSRYLYPFLPLDDRERLVKRLEVELKDFNIPLKEIEKAAALAWKEEDKFHAEIYAKAKEVLAWMKEHHTHGLVLAGRPYHLDPEINHGIHAIASNLGWAVLTEDGVAPLGELKRPLRVVDQWTYHTRLYHAAAYVAERPELELVQLTSFACGLDAVTQDQVAEILKARERIYTLIKIDEQSGAGPARIRLRSLLASIRHREAALDLHTQPYEAVQRPPFTPAMRKTHTILAPEMAPLHFRLVEAAFRYSGYKLEIPQVDNKEALAYGLQFVHNDACYPSILVVGQLLAALKSGRYDLENTSVIITQTGGGCRATNYIAFIRKALKDAGMDHIPVISLSAQGLETNPGFKIGLKMAVRSLHALIYGDLLMRLLYATRPREAHNGDADRLAQKWEENCRISMEKATSRQYHKNIREMVREFDELPLREEAEKKPEVGVVGEILVKFHPGANNDIVSFLELEGAVAVVPDLLGFFLYACYGNIYRAKYLSGSKKAARMAKLEIALLEAFRGYAKKTLHKSKRFEAPPSIYELADFAKEVVQLGHQTGEGWFLTGEMLELIHSGVKKIACIQPFACLPNQVTGKAVIKTIRKLYPEVTVSAIDYDPGASEVNQNNRLKLLLSDE